MNPIVVLDACVMFPAQVRSLLMYLAGAKLLRPRWTDRIDDEWMRNLLARRSDLTREKLRGVQELMRRHVPDAITTDYEHLIETLELPSENDRHVLAAAIQARATIIVTFNLKDFPDAYLAPYGLKALHPDTLVAKLLMDGQSATAVCEALARHRAEFKRPAKSVEEYLAMLEAVGFKDSVALVRPESDRL
jgi:hypothetical protein